MKKLTSKEFFEQARLTKDYQDAQDRVNIKKLNISDNFVNAQNFLKTISRLKDLRSGSRRKDIVELRRKVRDILRKEFNLSYPAIVKINIGYKHHTGAMR